MWCTSHTAEVIHQAANFGYTVGDSTFDWSYVKGRRDAYVKRLNGVYRSGLDKLGITSILGEGKITGPGSVEVDGTVYKVRVVLHLPFS